MIIIEEIDRRHMNDIELLLNRKPSDKHQLYLKVTQEGKPVTKGDKTQVLGSYPEHIPIKSFVHRGVSAPAANAALGQNADIAMRSRLLLLFNHTYARLTEPFSVIGARVDLEILALPAVDDKKKVSPICTDKYFGGEVQDVLYLGGELLRAVTLTFTRYQGEQPQKDPDGKDAGKCTYGQDKDLMSKF
jgi:hypothetical protein